MKHGNDGSITAGADTADAWLAGIKAEAARRKELRDVSAMSEDELIDEAARGMAERRAARHDFIGALAWEEIAEGPRRRNDRNAPAAPRHIDETGCPAVERTSSD
ncbi:hypothetical protein [Streptomyces sp. SP2-10]|uniref:hypothetical protein n=1 Tax=Streptomyces sp. SP2-10 TaxID=2873385 RepID=UPI001CA7B2DA|nr:hypothetical protein [Streptomyces sp. SP2-10]MBY8840423.1 hypothetical protein [Streptomyces sp. SP2-10]